MTVFWSFPQNLIILFAYTLLRKRFKFSSEFWGLSMLFSRKTVDFSKNYRISHFIWKWIMMCHYSTCKSLSTFSFISNFILNVVYTIDLYNLVKFRLHLSITLSSTGKYFHGLRKTWTSFGTHFWNLKNFFPINIRTIKQRFHTKETKRFLRIRKKIYIKT